MGAEPTWQALEPFYCPNLNLGRAAIAEKALELGFDVLLWIDSDITFSVDAARGIVERAHELDALVGGLYLEKKLGGRPRADFLETIQGRLFAPDSPMLEVRSIGFGLVAHRASMLTSIAAHHALPWQSIEGDERVPVRVRPFFTPDTRSATTTTDDYVFCTRAREAGFKIFADTRFRLGHLGEYEFTLDDMLRK